MTNYRRRPIVTSAVTAAVVVMVVALGIAGGRAPQVSPQKPEATGFRTAQGAPDREAVLKAYGELPLAFVENRGQTDRRVRYYLQGSRAAFFLTQEGIVMALVAGDAERSSSAGRTGPGAAGPITPVRHSPGSAGPRAATMRPVKGVALALRFLGSSPAATIAGDTVAPGTVNYLRGSDRRGWHTDLSRFSQVVYRELWPGIDLVLRGHGTGLKYEFRVRPGARPADIRLAYEGAKRVSVDGQGALVIDTALGVVRDSAPVSWQEVEGARVPVASRYLLARNSYGFEVGGYNRDRELIIDPGLDYSTFLGGSSNDSAGGVDVDPAGNAYVVGHTQSTNFPTTTGAFDRTFNGGLTDVFVAKLSPNGSSLVYSTYLGGVPTPLRRGSGDNVEFGRAIAVDGGGNAYITGLTDSSNFPTTAAAFRRTLNVCPPDAPNEARDAFVTKLNPSGSALVYSTFLGGCGFDDGWGIAVDGTGEAYVTGDTDSADFPTTAGAAQRVRGGGRDAFVTRLNASGSALVYSTYLGGLDNEIGNGVAVDAAGNTYAVGGTRSADFPTTAGSFQPTHNGGAFDTLFDGFVTKLNGAGALVYSTFLGGSDIETVDDVAVDAAGSAYASGSTISANFPTTAGAFDRTSRGGFVSKLNPAGSALVYSTFLGGANAAAIVVDVANRAWVGGAAADGAPTTADAFSRVNRGGSDAWLARLNATGSALEFATFIGGSGSDGGVDVALDAADQVYLAGNTISFDFPTTAGAFDTTFAGDPLIFWGDAFVAKFGSGTGNPNPPPTRTTTTFSGTLATNRLGIHSVHVGSAGPVDFNLNWAVSAANLTLRVRDWNGVQIFFISGTARPKTRTIQAPHAIRYDIEVANPSSRSTGYTLSVTHPFANSFPGGVSFLSLDPSTVSGGATSVGAVSLTTAAPAGGGTVALSSSNTAAATVPASVVVQGGNNSATFTVTTNTVSANATSTITATLNGISQSATLTVNAAGGPAMSSLALSPTVVQGGSTSTATATLTGPAPSGGAVLSLDSSNTDVATVPATATVPAGQTSTTFVVSTSPQQFDQSSAISASHGGVIRTVILSVTPGAAAPGLSSLSLSPTSVSGGSPSTGTVRLAAAAPAGGVLVQLASSNTAAATVPASVTIGAGNTSATFTVPTTSVTANTTSTISGTANGVTRSATLSITAAGVTPAALASVAVNPASVTGGNSSAGTVTLTAAAPAGGFVVALSSSQAAAKVPASVTVAQGATNASFTVSTTSVIASTPVTITASAGSVTRTATLTLTPSGSTVTLTVTATGRSGERVLSSPAGINVNVGSTGSASFSPGASITLSVTNGRDAIWSGACSSGGNKTRTCTFTPNANASVGANVQ